MNVVAHADLVAVINHRRPRHRQQQRVQKLDAPVIAFKQRCQSPADAEVQACTLVGGVVVPQIVALLVGDHFQRRLVVVAQENHPLAVGGDVRCLAQDVGDRKTVFLGQRHVHAWHQREVERHVTFVAIAKISLCVFGRSEEHTSELQTLMRISYAVFCLKKKKKKISKQKHKTEGQEKNE